MRATLLKIIRVGFHGLADRPVISAIALSVALLAASFLLLVLHFVNGDHLLPTQLAAARANLKTNDEDLKFFDRAMLRMNTLSDVEYVTPLKARPCGRGATTGFMVEGRAPTTPDKWPVVNYRTVNPDYFRAKNIPVVQGRSFDERDKENARPVLMVNQAAAEKSFPGVSPVGKRVTFGSTDSDGRPIWFEIVGVTSNIQSTEEQKEPAPEVYFSANDPMIASRPS